MKSALILSPFASWPADVGHRRRTLQTTAMLKALGYRITFLLYAFEGPWYWRFQEEDFAEMAAQWDEVIVHHADHSVGLPPKHGKLHHLDEWWSPALENHLANLFSRRSYDIFVVHNVWLSRALATAPSGVVKVLETHDLFFKRRAILDRYGIGHDFFEIDEASELFGIDRADIAVAIQDEDARELLGKARSRVVSLPFFDDALLAEAPGLLRGDYLHPNKVTFGFLGSAHTYNIHGMQAVLDALEPRVAASFAPVDVALAGSVCDSITSRLPIRKMGRVPTETGFYANCDIALAAAFDGTGFKIKVGDCLALGMPSLVARHSAIGTGLKGSVVVDTPEEMADLMVNIALRRPALATLRAPIVAGRDELRNRVARGTASLRQLMRDVRPVLVIDLSAYGPEFGALPLMSWLATARHTVRLVAPVLLLRADVLKIVEPVLAPGVRATTREGFAEIRDDFGRARFIDACGTGTTGLPLRMGDKWVRDTRWNWLLQEDDAQVEAMSYLPIVHPDGKWDPSVLAVQKAARKHRDRAVLDAEKLVVGVWPDSGGKRRVMRLKDRFACVDIRYARQVEDLMLEMLDIPEGSREIIWCADTSAASQMVFQIAGLTKQTVSGLLGGPVVGKFVPGYRFAPGFADRLLA